MNEIALTETQFLFQELWGMSSIYDRPKLPEPVCGPWLLIRCAENSLANAIQQDKYWKCPSVLIAPIFMQQGKKAYVIFPDHPRSARILAELGAAVRNIRRLKSGQNEVPRPITVKEWNEMTSLRQELALTT